MCEMYSVHEGLDVIEPGLLTGVYSQHALSTVHTTPVERNMQTQVQRLLFVVSQEVDIAVDKSQSE